VNRVRVLTLLAIRALLRLRLYIQTSLPGSYICAKVPEVQEDTILANRVEKPKKRERERSYSDGRLERSKEGYRAANNKLSQVFDIIQAG